MVNVGSVRNSTVKQTDKRNTFATGAVGGWGASADVYVSTPEKGGSPPSVRNKN